MTVYVYKQYNDDYAYGEEKITVYANQDEAEEALKEDVENACGASWDDIPDHLNLDSFDTFEIDYVSINNGDSTSFWIIEEKEII